MPLTCELQRAVPFLQLCLTRTSQRRLNKQRGTAWTEPVTWCDPLEMYLNPPPPPPSWVKASAWRCVGGAWAGLTHGGPGQSHDHPGGRDVVHPVHGEQRLADVVVQVVGRDGDGVVLTAHDLEGHLAAHLGAEGGMDALPKWKGMRFITQWLQNKPHHAFTRVGWICHRKHLSLN